MDDTAPAMIQQRDLLKDIATAIVRVSGGGWALLQYSISALGGFREEVLEAVDAEGARARIPVPREARPAVTSLRKVMYTPDAGTWYGAIITVQESLSYSADFDYDGEPAWQVEPGLQEYPLEQRVFPRSEAITPAWFRRKLALATSGG